MIVIASLGLVSSIGCSKSEFEVAPVKGKVICHGDVVSMGMVIFSPQGETADQVITGKRGGAELESDGTFNISTYKLNDGAIVGRHKVMYMPPETGGRPPSGCGMKEPIEIEVPRSGLTDLVIDITMTSK